MSSSKLYTEHHVRTWKSAKQLLQTFPPRWVFRGQRSKVWGLKTSYERATERAGLPKNETAEKALLNEFKRRAHHYLPSQWIPNATADLEWLALMQHHGAPTRLLDFTKSPYVAAYFALESADSHSTIWAINSDWCKRGAVSVLKEAAPKENNDLWGSSGNSNKTYIKAVLHTNWTGVAPVEPFHLNERLTIQQGLFMYPGNIMVSFEDNLYALVREAGASEFREHVHRINLPVSVRLEALDELRQMNVYSASLFPGLDGFAQSLWFELEFHGNATHLRKKFSRQPKSVGKNL